MFVFPQNWYVVVLTSKVMELGGGPLEDWSGHEGRASMSKISAFSKEIPESSLVPSNMWGHSEKTASDMVICLPISPTVYILWLPQLFLLPVYPHHCCYLCCSHVTCYYFISQSDSLPSKFCHNIWKGGSYRSLCKMLTYYTEHGMTITQNSGVPTPVLWAFPSCMPCPCSALAFCIVPGDLLMPLMKAPTISHGKGFKSSTPDK